MNSCVCCIGLSGGFTFDLAFRALFEPYDVLAVANQDNAGDDQGNNDQGPELMEGPPL